MPSIVNKKAGRRRSSEPADRHSIHIKLSDQEFDQLERDLANASKGPGGAVRHGAYSKNAILSHAKLFALREAVSSLVSDANSIGLSGTMIDRIRSALKA